jgi:hypothetical protein
LTIKDGKAYQTLPVIEEDSDGCGTFQGFAIPEEISQKYDLI